MERPTDGTLSSLLSREGAPPRPLADTLNEIGQLCEQLSADHRRGYPPEAVMARLHELTRQTRVLFQEWTIEICFLLDEQRVMRFNQMKKSLEGISTRTLAAKLEILRGLGFVDRTLYDHNPPLVEYRLTPAGHRFVNLLLPTFMHAYQVGTV